MGRLKLRWLISVAPLTLLAGCGTAGHGATTTVAPGGATGLIPAVSQKPAAGICAGQRGSVVVVYLDYTSGGTPDPRWSRVRPGQHLEVINRNNRLDGQGKAITVSWPPFGRHTVAPGDAVVFKQDFGSYLAPGDHILALSIYENSGAEILLGR